MRRASATTSRWCAARPARPPRGDDRRPAAAAAATPRRRCRRCRRARARSTLDLRVGMGEKLRVRGRGLDAGLRGELHITSPGGRLARQRHAARGRRHLPGVRPEARHRARRAHLRRAGREPASRHRGDPAEPRRAGRRAVTGTALNPRIRLFSEPEMSDIDKLSWLVLGRASDDDRRRRHRAAAARRAGPARRRRRRARPTSSSRRSASTRSRCARAEGDVARDRSSALGKQLSKRWYVGYERGLNATAGSWQLIYRSRGASRCARRPAATTRST